MGKNGKITLKDISNATKEQEKKEKENKLKLNKPTPEQWKQEASSRIKHRPVVFKNKKKEADRNAARKSKNPSNTKDIE